MTLLRRGPGLPLAWLLLWACGDGDARTDLRCGDRECTSDCTKVAGDPCDLLEESCRERILAAVICVRGTQGHMPEIRTWTSDEYRMALLDSGMLDAGSVRDEDGGGEEVAADSQDSVPKPVDAWSIALSLLKLLPKGAGVTESAIESVIDFTGGYYEADARRITLIDRGAPQESWSANALFAHELVHALQDQAFGLSELFDRAPRSHDGAFAHRCLVEGDAELYEAMALALLQGLEFDHGYVAQQGRARAKYARGEVLRSEAPYGSVWQLAYPIGRSFLHDAFRDGGNWSVQSLFEAVPHSAIHWMVGYAENRARREHLVLPLACGAAATPPGYERWGNGVLGAAIFFVFLGQVLVPPGGVLAAEEHWRNALHWRQDDLTVFQAESGEVALSYRVRLDDSATAKRLADELSGSARVSLKVVRHGDELELLAAEDAAVLSSWHTDPTECPIPP